MSTSPSTTTLLPGTGHLDQAFLVGESVYVRSVEVEDAACGQSWTNTILPRSSTWYKKWIRKEMPKDWRSNTYVILRKDTDVPVGSVRTHRADPIMHVHSSVDPLLGERGDAWRAEALGLVVPWLGVEQHRPMVGIWLTSDEGQAMEALLDLGAREAVRYREARLGWGGRTDLVYLEYPNPHWIERLGDPADIPLERSGTGEPRPVHVPVVLTADPPANAVKIGARVYLRPFTKDDAPLAARWSRQETETEWDAGRWMRSTPGFESWTSGEQKVTPPQSARFAVCLRDNDELIGWVGISDIDYIHGVAESGSQIFRPEYRGGGYGSEAKHLLFDYAFNTLNLHALQSTVIFPNTRSAAALRKQGYREAGRLHWSFPSFGSFENEACFDLLATDWRALPRTEYTDAHEDESQ